jgi:hypothetical protein
MLLKTGWSFQSLGQQTQSENKISKNILLELPLKHIFNFPMIEFQCGYLISSNGVFQNIFTQTSSAATFWRCGNEVRSDRPICLRNPAISYGQFQESLVRVH